MADDPFYLATERHFAELDSAFERGGTVFANEAEREGHETWVMRVYRKRQACRYHLDRLNELLASRLTTTEQILKPRADAGRDLTGIKVTATTMRYGADTPEPAYELSAFLASLRSAIDHLAQIVLKHHGVDGKLTELLSSAKSGNLGGPGVDQFIAQTEWLESVRAYRDALIHSYILHPSSGGERQTRDGVVATVVYPVVVPKGTPTFRQDTRRSRAAQSSSEPPPGVQVAESVQSAESGGKRPTVVRLELSAAPAPGFERIEEFAARHMGAFEGLYIAVLDALTTEKFRDLRKPRR